MGEIPEDIYRTAEKVWSEADGKIIRIDAIGVIASAILAERQRFAAAAWDFYYGEKRGHMTPEDFAGFLQGPAPKFAVTSQPTTEE